jgi:putative transposase
MHGNGMKPKRKKNFKITTDSKPSLAVAENKLNQKFELITPNQRWTADITYIWPKEGRLYLTVVLDWFSKMGVYAS